MSAGGKAIEQVSTRLFLAMVPALIVALVAASGLRGNIKVDKQGKQPRSENAP
jgi:hypothetical protein